MQNYPENILVPSLKVSHAYWSVWRILLLNVQGRTTTS
jgi:hypothetical protein